MSIEPVISLVVLQVDRLGRIRVEARFLINGGGGEELLFVNQQIRIPSDQVQYGHEVLTKITKLMDK